MYTVTDTYKANVKDPTKRQSFLLIPYDYDETAVPSFFFSDDNDFSDAGVTINDYFCTGDDLRFGESPASTLSCEIINRYGLVTRDDLQDSVAMIGTETNSGAGNANCPIRIGDTYFYAKDDGFYKGSTKLVSGNFISLMGICEITERPMMGNIVKYIIYAFSDEGVYTYKNTTSAVSENPVPCSAYMMHKMSTPRSFLLTYTRPAVIAITQDPYITVESVFPDVNYIYEFCPMGVFIIGRAKITNTNVITLSDCLNQMSFFDKFADETISKIKEDAFTTVYEIAQQIRSDLGLRNSPTGLDDSTTLIRTDFIEPHSTYRQLLNWLAEYCLGTIVMSRLIPDEFDLRKIGTDVVRQYAVDDISSDGFLVGAYSTKPVSGVRLTLTDGSVKTYGNQDNPYCIYNNPLYGISLYGDVYNKLLATPVYNPVSCTIINAEPYVSIGDLINIPVAPDGYVYAGDELEALTTDARQVYREPQQYVTCPLLQRTFRWNGRCHADYIINGNEYRDVDAAEAYSATDPNLTQNDLNDGFSGTAKTLLNPYGDIAKTGNIVTVNGTATTVPSGDATSVAYISLDKGVWLITAWVRFPSNATGYRKLLLSNDPHSATARSANARVIAQAVDGDNTEMELVIFARVDSSGETIYENVIQNSGSSLSVTGRIYVMQIA